MRKSDYRASWLPTLLLLTLAAALGLLGAQACEDKDRDNIANDNDNCRYVYNPKQNDEDQDAEGDACDEETPLYGRRFANCYQSTLVPIQGDPVEDIVTAILAVDDVSFTMEAQFPQTLNFAFTTGEGRHNGRDFWFMSDDLTSWNFTGWFVEGVGAEPEQGGTVQLIQGSYILLECLHCYGDPDMDDYVYWTELSHGDWLAQRMPPDYCALESDDDDDDDDDDDNDDNDDDDNNDNDDMTAPAAADDDDDEEGNCGC